MLAILDYTRTRIGTITDYEDLEITHELENGDKSISFRYLGSDIIRNEYYVQTDTDRFTIKEVSPDESGSEYHGQLDLEDLQRVPFKRFTSKGQTLQAAATAALQGTGWTVQTTISTIRNVQRYKVTALDALYAIRDAWMCEIAFDNLNKVVTFAETIGQDRGVYFMRGINLKKVSSNYDSYDYVTRLIPYGADGLTIESVNDGIAYVENYQYTTKILSMIWEDTSYEDAQALKDDAIKKLADLSKPKKSFSCDVINLAKESGTYSILDYGIGDTIHLVDDLTGTDELQRIVKLVEHPHEPEEDSCEISNTVLTFEELQDRMQKAADAWEDISNSDGTVNGVYVHGVEMDNIVGIEVLIGDGVTTNGVVSNVAVLYAQGDSPTEAPSSGWSTTAPAWDSGKYMWQKTITTYVNGEEEETAETNISGADGFSPEVTVTKEDAVTTITVTDANGTTSATIEDSVAYYIQASVNAIVKNVQQEIPATPVTFDQQNNALVFPASEVADIYAQSVSQDIYGHIIISNAAALQDVFSPTSVTFSAKVKAGDGDPENYSGRFAIAESTDGITWIDRAITTVDAESVTYCPTWATVQHIRCTLYQAGGTDTVLDVQTVAVINDGTVAYGKTRNYYNYANDPPTGGNLVVGDTWFVMDANDDVVSVKRWDGSTWADTEYTSGIFSYINAGKVTTGTLSSGDGNTYFDLNNAKLVTNGTDGESTEITDGSVVFKNGQTLSKMAYENNGTKSGLNIDSSESIYFGSFSDPAMIYNPVRTEGTFTLEAMKGIATHQGIEIFNDWSDQPYIDFHVDHQQNIRDYDYRVSINPNYPNLLNFYTPDHDGSIRAENEVRANIFMSIRTDPESTLNPHYDFYRQSYSRTAYIEETSNGSLIAHNTISNASDERLKKDIALIDESYAEIIDRIEAKEYRYREGDESRHFGFIAQDVIKVLDELGIVDQPIVHGTGKGEDYFSIDYAQITSLLVLYVQMLKRDIDQLKDELKRKA